MARVLRRFAWLSVLALAPAWADPGRVADAAYGESLFHYYQDDHFTALTQMMAAQARARIPRDWAEAELLKGSLKLSYGLTDSAEAIFRRLLTDDVPAQVRDRAWYYLARLAFQRGRLDQAMAALTRMGSDLPPELRGRRQLLGALVLMEQGDYRAAAEALQPWQGLAEDEPYARYNLGIALIRSGHLEDGVATLERLNRNPAATAEAAALRDKANLAIAQALLAQQPERAKQALRRVRLHGPHATQALLGAGWAEVGARRYQDALLPWNELLRLPIDDPAVQEAWLAVPYVLSELGTRDQAAEAYRAAIDALEAETARIDQAMAAVERGELLDALRDLDPRGEQLPPPQALPGNAYLGQLLASHGFRRALKDFQDLESLQANLRYWRIQLDGYEQLHTASRQRLEAVQPVTLARLRALNAERVRTQREALLRRQPSAEALAALDRALADLDAGQEALLRAPDEARRRLDRLAEQIALARLRLDNVEPRLQQALERQRRLLDLRALQQLGARRDHLRAQIAQARFALAQLYDPAAERPQEQTP